MKKILAAILTFALAIGFTGCGDVSKVKNGTLEFDKSLTIGEAFDNYKYFKKTDWSEITTDNGKKVVQVDGIVNMDIHPRGPEWKKNVKEMKYIFQFTINKDETFEISYFGVEGVNNNDEKQEYNANNFQMMQALKEIYSNQPVS